jgi:hypothetical protein
MAKRTISNLQKWVSEFRSMSESEQEIVMHALNYIRNKRTLKRTLPPNVIRLIPRDKE